MSIPIKNPSLLGWLWQSAQLQSTPVPLAACVRAMIAVTVPAALGLITGHVAEAALVSLGALPAATGDQGGPYRARAVSIGVTVLLGAAGYGIGGLIGGHTGVSAVIVLALLLLLSLVGTWGNVLGRATLQCAIYLIVGAGVRTPLPFWLPPLLIAAGGLFGMALMLLGWFVHPAQPEQQAVADVYRRIGSLLAASGKNRILQARRELHGATTVAYDCLLSARRAAIGRDARLQRLAAQLMAATPIMNASLMLVRREQSVPPAVSRVLQDIADQVAQGVPAAARIAGQRLRALGVPAIDETLGTAFDSVAPLLSGLSAPDHALSGLMKIRERKRIEWRAAWRAFRAGTEIRRYLLRIGLCLAAAELVAAVAPLPRAYWVPLVVVVVFKPNFGSIFARAVQCCVGSMIGVGLSAAVLAVDRNGLTSLGAIALLSFALPWGLKRNYGVFSALLLPIIMLLIGALQPGSWPIALARLADATVASLIVVLIGYLPWARYEKAQLNQRVAGTIDAICSYLAVAYGGEPVAKYTQRRRVYGVLSDLRIGLQRALAEPAAVGRRAAAWWPVAVALERIVNAITDGMIAEKNSPGAPTVDRGGEVAPEMAPEVVPFAAALRDLAAAIRETRAPRPIALPAQPKFKELANEIAALHAVVASVFSTPAARAASTRPVYKGFH